MSQVRVSDVPLFAGMAVEDAAAARQLPGRQEAGSNGRQVEQPAVPPSWVAVLSGEEELHRLRADEGIPLRLEGALSLCLANPPLLQPPRAAVLQPMTSTLACAMCAALLLLLGSSLPHLGP